MALQLEVLAEFKCNPGPGQKGSRDISSAKYTAHLGVPPGCRWLTLAFDFGDFGGSVYPRGEHAGSVIAGHTYLLIPSLI